MIKTFDEIKDHLFSPEGITFYPRGSTLLTVSGSIVTSIDKLSNGRIVINYDDGTGNDYPISVKMDWKLYDIVERLDW